MKKEAQFKYEWKLSNGYPGKNGMKVFSCFACGGGSTMGYKLAGFEVVGMNEIDPRMAECYIANHNPKFPFIEPIQEFKNRDDLPHELYNLDILDGSPPCSSFSMSGIREKAWGKEKKFSEGQSEQVLDTLFFDFIDVAAKLQPKIVVAENVKGLLLGNAKEYVKKIYKAFDKAGYYVEKWLLDASEMGVPQRRERVFFCAMRKDLAGNHPGDKVDMFNPLPWIDMGWKEKPIPYSRIRTGLGRRASDLYYGRWEKRKPSDRNFGDITERISGTGSCFSDVFAKDEIPLPTITAKCGLYDFNSGHFVSDESLKMGGSYPLDYNFKTSKPGYLIGMSVPPVMTAQIATRIKEYWLDKI